MPGELNSTFTFIFRHWRTNEGTLLSRHSCMLSAERILFHFLLEAYRGAVQVRLSPFFAFTWPKGHPCQLLCCTPCMYCIAQPSPSECIVCVFVCFSDCAACVIHHTPLWLFSRPGQQPHCLSVSLSLSPSPLPPQGHPRRRK